MNPNLSGHQFEQLQMFMTPDEVINRTEKLDTNWRTALMSPREQWEHPQSAGHEPLREYKLREAQEKDWSKKPYGTMPPLHLVHKEKHEGVKLQGPLLTDGHHRLALAQHRGHPFVAVMHHNTEDEWDEYGYDYSLWGED